MALLLGHWAFGEVLTANTFIGAIILVVGLAMYLFDCQIKQIGSRLMHRQV